MSICRLRSPVFYYFPFFLSFSFFVFQRLLLLLLQLLLRVFVFFPSSLNIPTIKHQRLPSIRCQHTPIYIYTCMQIDVVVIIYIDSCCLLPFPVLSLIVLLSFFFSSLQPSPFSWPAGTFEAAGAAPPPTDPCAVLLLMINVMFSPLRSRRPIFFLLFFFLETS